MAQWRTDAREGWREAAPEKEDDVSELRKKIREDCASRHEFITERAVIVQLPSGRRAEHDSLRRALNDPHLETEKPCGLKITMRSAGISLSIEFGDAELDIRASPEGDGDVLELFTRCRRWAEKHQPARHLRILHESRPMPQMLLLAVTMLAVLATVASQRGTKDEAHKLLEDGLTQDEHVRATELLLTLESNYRRDSDFTGVAAKLAVSCLLLGVIISIMPSTRLGIGRGKESVVRWRKWLTFMSVSAPGFILLNVLWPLVPL